MALVSYFGNQKYAPLFQMDNLIDFREETLIKGLDPNQSEKIVIDEY